MASPRPGAARWVGLLAALIGAELVAGGALVVHRSVADWEPRVPAATGASHARALPDRAAETSAGVQALLTARAAAVRAHDEPAFLAGLDPLAPDAFRRAQQRSFVGASTLPLASWSYEVVGTQLHELSASRRARYGGASTYSPDVLLRYRLSGYDVHPAVELLRYTFVLRSGRWYLGADDDFALSGERSDRGPWDFGALRLVSGASSLVLFHPGSEQLARQVAAEVDRAVPHVGRAWARAWAQRVVAVVPRSRSELEQLIGEEHLESIAAVATADLPTGMPGEEAVGDRVLVNPEAFRRLGPTGRRVVLTHEVTHVATRQSSPDGMPTWLVEGFADYVGFSGAGVATAQAASELRRDVRHGVPLRGLPSGADFDAESPRLAQAYEGAWLAVRLLGERLGAAGAADFYAAVAAAVTAGSTGDEAVTQALASTVQMSIEEFTAQWADYVRGELR